MINKLLTNVFMKKFPRFSKKTIEYKGFTVTQDNMLGWSMFDRSDNWCCSVSNRNMMQLFDTIDRIISYD